MKRIITLAFALLCIGLQGAWAQTDVSSESELTAAIKDGANIRLTSDIALGSLLKIGDGAKHVVTIDLNGHKLSRSLSAINSNGHVIEVFGTDDKLTLKNGTISGGWAENGGGICNFGQLVLESVTITNCKGTNGGGIHNKAGATLTINDGSITGCSTTDGSGGGAIVNHGKATISGCTMSNNTAGTRGGAIWSDGSELKIETSTFDNNQAVLQGGAFYLDKGEVNLAAVKITNNTSEDAGGIFVGSDAQVVLRAINANGSTVSGNTSSKHGGGGIVNNGNLTLYLNVTITDNKCYTDGGGIWNNGQLKMYGKNVVNGNTTTKGETSNVFLKTGKTISLDSYIYEGSIIGVKLEGNAEGIITSGYKGVSSNAPSTYFKADNDNQMVILSGDEAKLVQKKDAVSYIERTWDEASRSVVSTTKSTLDYTELSGSGSDVTLESGKWYVVKGSSVTRSRLKINSGTSHLILCDGAKLSSVVSFYNSTAGALSVYGQANDTGQLVADASGTSECSGIGGPEEDKSGGKLVVHGGTLTAQGGSYAAGIGGGNDADGGELIVYGGSVSAYGGTDAAGIGGGEDGSGGVVTIYGGTVFADGTGWGAGIGGGEDNKGATVRIYGGSVTAWAGSDAGDKNGCAIGSEDDDKGSLEFGPNMAVRAGESPSSISRFTKDERTSACWYRPYCEITRCDHDGAAYTVSGATVNDTHTLVCTYCAGANAEKHVFSDDKCTICGVSKQIWTASIYLPELVDGKYVNGHYSTTPRTMKLIDQAQFTLPAPPADRMPEGVTFAGWRVGTPSGLGITSYAKGDDEKTLEAGYNYTMTSDVSFTARYITNVVDLYDDQINNYTILGNDNKIARPATLLGRMLYKDGSWNTLCLPFDLPIAGSTLDGDGVDVRTLVSSSYANGLLTLNFTEKGEVTTIEAGKPYLIKWDSGEDLLNPKFDEVVIKNNLTYVKTDHVTFMGIYRPKRIDETSQNKTNLYVGPNNMLYYASAPDGKAFFLNSFRAYFQLNYGFWADADGIHGRTDFARQIVLNFGGDATAIRTVEAEEGRADDAWYDLNGRRLTGKPVQKGVYVKNGKKVVIR